jgi:prolyl oligopeptidase
MPKPLAMLLAAGSIWAADAPPATLKHPVTDIYHGVKVVDDYRWLEDPADPAVRAWSDAQNGYARQYLDALPMRAALEKELQRLLANPSPRYRALVARHGKLFALKTLPPNEQPFLVTFDSPDNVSAVRTIIDPAQADPTGHTAIDFFVPSPDGRYVAVSLSQGGSESGNVHVYETATGKPLGDVVERVNGGTAGGSVAWNADGSGFYYTRYPRAGERPPADLDFYQQIWFHKLGSREDTYSLGKDFPRIAEIALEASEDGRYVLARMSNGDGGEYAHYLLGPPSGAEARWTQVARFADDVVSIEFGHDGFLYLLSRQNAPMGKILKLPIDKAELAGAQTVVPESGVAIEDFVPAGERLYVADLVGGPSQIRVFDTAGHPHGTVPLEPVSAVTEMLRYAGQLLFQSNSYVHPPAWKLFDPASGKVAATQLAVTSPADFSDTEVLREFAVSKDGTKVPLTILRRKDTRLDGRNPVLLYGYGGYGVSLSPSFAPNLRPLLERGVVYAVANLRGGGEYGDAWHRAGNLTHKQNVFDDFASCARFLIDRHYTTPERLAIEGGSNGGLLMGAELTQHPELFHAVVSHVGIYDMLRVELSPNGAFNVTEFGTVKELSQFRSLYAYSPYHHVVDGTPYPAVLFLTGANDPRVDPANSRKMTARLQASGTRQPVLLRTSGTSGHGIGTALSERIAEQADVLAFLFAQWGIQ